MLDELDVPDVFDEGERNGPEGPPRPVSVSQSPQWPERVAVLLDYDTKYVGFGSLYVRSA
ncbi:hypothetical protein GCM10011578_006480 [Streptomyces fuscichromogenes]|uniref:Uncharacterized protein n=1 Tax=Streptomyces fuscichromogenes TaxID=1324013 RepID=A0A917X8J1_9ACTN|nr:hypothetical protein GCM10011578_006480 [Streptomyces fuscichromogenes]